MDVCKVKAMHGHTLAAVPMPKKKKLNFCTPMAKAELPVTWTRPLPAPCASGRGLPLAPPAMLLRSQEPNVESVPPPTHKALSVCGPGITREEFHSGLGNRLNGVWLSLTIKSTITSHCVVCLLNLDMTVITLKTTSHLLPLRSIMFLRILNN